MNRKTRLEKSDGNGTKRGLSSRTLLSVSALAMTAGGIVVSHSASAAPVTPAMVTVTHTSPGIVARNEPIGLSFRVACKLPATAEYDMCATAAVLHVRNAGDKSFHDVALQSQADDATFVTATLSASDSPSSDHVDYYATVTEPTTNTSVDFPISGSVAPQQVWVTDNPQLEDIGNVDFTTPTAAVKVAHMQYGTALGSVGLSNGAETERLGPAAFDVDQAGNVSVLDEINRRVQHNNSGKWSDGGAIDGSSTNMIVGDDGTTYVLDSSGAKKGRRIRALHTGGSESLPADVEERNVSAIRESGGNVEALQYPSLEWKTVVDHGYAVDVNTQRQNAHALMHGTNGDVVVSARRNETRIGIIHGGHLSHAWFVHSGTSMADIQVADAQGNNVLLVQTAYDGKHTSVLAQGLRPNAGPQQLGRIDIDSWADAGGSGRVRIHGNKLYAMSSTAVHLRR